jgi:bleomycin hydrolase
MNTRLRWIVLGVIALAWVGVSPRAWCQENGEESKPAPTPYEFTEVHKIECTPVKNQDQTGSCWCFAATSFLESELIRQGKGVHNLSEMFAVKNTYLDKAQNYVLRQGKANFGEGALAHDFVNAAERYGLVPEEVYSGIVNGSEHNHGEMVSLLTPMVEAAAKLKRPSPRWPEAVGKVLDVYMGNTPTEFSYQGKTYTPSSLAKELDFKASDYVSLTSYTHHPFHRSFVLEIPDNFSNGLFYNVPVDDLIATIDHALEKGYGIAWDGDVSEPTFSAGKGLAILPESGRENPLDSPGAEQAVDQEMRQATLRSFQTTDDHLMHLVGSARDQNGTKYYLIKNSWGSVGPKEGYLYMSEAYARLKTVSILIHKDSLPENLRVQ